MLMRKLTYLAILFFLAFLGPLGCHGFSPTDSWPSRRPLGADLAGPASTHPPGPPAAGPTEPDGDLSLRDALRLAVAGSPELAGFAWSVRSAEAEQLQAGLLPNPEVEIEYENFAGTGEFRGTRALETTIALGQLVELGGKRGKRVRVASADRRLAGWDYEAKRIEVLSAVTKRFIAVLTAQKQEKLTAEDLSLAVKMLETVKKLIAAGKVQPTERPKADVAVAMGRIELRRAQRQVLSARGALAATWGSAEAKFRRVVGRLDQTAAIPPVDRLAALLADNPAIARWNDELIQRQAALALAEAGGVPDVTVGAAYRHMRETEDNDRAMVLTLSVPVPIFDRNQGEIRKARFEISKARADRRSAEVSLRAELEEAYQNLATAHGEAVALRDEVLPAAKSAFATAVKVFELGRAGYLDVLDGQRTLIEVRGKHLSALAAYHQAVADVERLTAAPLNNNTTTPEKKAQTQPAAKENGNEK